MERSPVVDAQLVAQLLLDALPALLLLPEREIALLPVAAVVKEGVGLPELQLQALGVALTSEVGVAVAVAHGLLAAVGVGWGMVPVAEAQGVGLREPLLLGLCVALLGKEGVALMQALRVAAAAVTEPRAPLGEAEALPGAAEPVAGATVALPAGDSEAEEEAVAGVEALPAFAAAAPPPMVALLQGVGLLEGQGCALKLEVVHVDALELAHSLLLRVAEAVARAVPLGNGVALAEPVCTPAVAEELKVEEGATGVALALPAVPCALPELLPVGSLPVAVALAEALGAPETEGGVEMLALLEGLRVSVAQGVAELL